MLQQRYHFKSKTFFLSILKKNILQKGIVQDKSYNEQHLDVLSSLNVAERVLNGPFTSDRILVTRLALSAAGLNYAQAEDALTQLRGQLTRLELICNVKELLYKLCDCSFLYWHQVIMPVYFSCLYETKSDISRMLVNHLKAIQTLNNFVFVMYVVNVQRVNRLRIERIRN